MSEKYKFLTTLGIWTCLAFIVIFGNYEHNTEIIKNCVFGAGIITFIIWW